MATELTEQQESELNAAIGKYRATAINPCGVCFYFDEGEERPYRIADDHASECFGTYQELLDAARAWKDAFDAE